METIKLRPHHILDIITYYGTSDKFEPHPYGAALHNVAKLILSEPEIPIELIAGADAICGPCKFLKPNKKCSDILPQLEEPISKQEYNDNLDNRLFKYYGFGAGTTMTMCEYCKLISSLIPGIEIICTHPKENQAQRLENLKKGLAKLGF